MAHAHSKRRVLPFCDSLQDEISTGIVDNPLDAGEARSISAGESRLCLRFKRKFLLTAPDVTRKNRAARRIGQRT
jgi:hypothetical protein